MTDQDLDRLFASVREEAVPEIATIRVDVLERVARTPERRSRFPLAAWMGALAATAAVVTVWTLRPVPTATLDLTPPRIAVAAPPQVLRPVAVRPPRAPRRIAPPPAGGGVPATTVIQTAQQTEMRMRTANPDVVIIWIAPAEAATTTDSQPERGDNINE